MPDSAMEEWARRELAKQDMRRWMEEQDTIVQRKRDREFRERHPWLARLLYGKQD